MVVIFTKNLIYSPLLEHRKYIVFLKMKREASGLTPQIDDRSQGVITWRLA